MNSESQSNSNKHELLHKLSELLFAAQRKPGKHQTRFSELQICGDAIEAARKNGLSYSDIASLLSNNGYPVRAAVIADFCRHSLKERNRRKKRVVGARAPAKRQADAVPAASGDQTTANASDPTKSAIGAADASKAAAPTSISAPKRPLRANASNPAGASGFRVY